MCKKVLLVVAVAFASLAASAQNIKISPVGLVTEGDKVTYYNPTTTLTVDLCVVRDVTVPGPYARYAQRYFGVVAPLSEKSTWRLESAALYYSDEQTPDVMPALPAATASYSDHLHSAEGFVAVLPDRTSTQLKSDEEMAAETAAAIFSLRQARLELITARAGENVFGAGLEAALEEIDHIENEYLSLFFGKQYTTREWRRYTFTPAEGEATHVVCRFSESVGLVDSSDLSASPVVVDFRPQGVAQTVVPPLPAVDNRRAEAPQTRTVKVAELVDCRVMSGRTVLAERTVPIYQLGVTAQMVK